MRLHVPITGVIMASLLEELIRELTIGDSWECRYERERDQANKYYERNLDQVLPRLAELIREMDDDSVIRHGLTKLFCLGSTRATVTIGDITVSRALYAGSDGKLYVAGPVTTLGTTRITIHRYSDADTKGWGGISLATVHDMVMSCVL